MQGFLSLFLRQNVTKKVPAGRHFCLQGRILLPAELRSYAGLEKDVTIIGNRNHAEIWATDVWNARRAAVSNEQRAARLRSLHI